MKILPQFIIKEIATAIANGNTCYFHRYTAKVTTIDPSTEDPALLAAQAKALALVEKKIGDYVKIEKLSNENQLVIMKDFLEELPDRSIRKQLSNALNRKNPVRNFNQAVESNMELSIHWGNFSFDEYQRWVSNLIIDAYNY